MTQQNGEVKVGGINVKDYDLTTLRNQVAMVLQKNVLFSGTIKENLRWGKENATEEEIIMACKQAQADEFINSFPDGYDTYIEQGGTNVSGGQKQRVASARAIITNPKLVLADEPTGALDSKSARQLLENFEFLNKQMKATILMVTHDAFTASYANRILFIKDGKIFNELIKGNDTRKQFFEKIIEVQTLLGGDLNDVI